MESKTASDTFGISYAALSERLGVAQAFLPQGPGLRMRPTFFAFARGINGVCYERTTHRMKKLIKCFLVAAVAALPALSALAEPDTATRTIFTNLVTSLVADNYDAFMAQCTPEMKATISKPALEHLSQQMAPRVKQGYNTQYLGELEQHGYKVHLWRLRFKDGSDDSLTTLCVKDGKAGSFNVMMFALYPPK